jgi:diguanylate cyclase (GGDEF)-like protein
MNLFDSVRRVFHPDNDALAPYRDRIGMQLSGLSATLLLPFGVVHALNGRWLLAGMNIALITTLVLNAWSLRQGRRPTVPFWLLICLLIVGVCTSVRLQGTLGLLWSYPALFICYFLLARRLALPLSLILVTSVSVIGSATLGASLGLRVLASQAFVLVMINVVLNVIAELQQALVAQAITDPLTGAYNRRHLQTQLEQLVAPTDPTRPADVLLAMDVDHFKQVNDRHGHDVGDEVLRRLVATVSTRKRRGDLLFRTGGEEFMLLLPRVTHEAAVTIAESLRQLLAQAELLPGETITVSIGVATLRAGQTPQAWIKRADQALYQAKRSGRNRVVVAEAP